MAKSNKKSIIDEYMELHGNINSVWPANLLENINICFENIEPTPVSGLSFNSFFGQQEAVTILKIALDASKQNKVPIGHTLLYGGPGLGKSLLAKTVACESGAYYKEFLGSELREKKSVNELLALLKTKHENKIVFIDEVHNINLKSAELLYEAMQEFSIKGVKIPKFCLIAATTYSGKIYRPLRERFAYSIKLSPYNMIDIVNMLQYEYSDFPLDVVKHIAERSKSIPRIGKHYANMVKCAAVSDESKVSIKHAKFVMQALGVNDDGLTKDDIKVLAFLISNGAPAGKNIVCSVLCIEQSDYDWLIEPTLLNMGFIQITPKGRTITDLGKQYIHKLISGGVNAQNK